MSSISLTSWAASGLSCLLTLGGAALSEWVVRGLVGGPETSRGHLRFAVLLGLSLSAWAGVLFLSSSPVLAAAIGIALAMASGLVLLDWVEGRIADLQSAVIFLAGLAAAPYLHPYGSWAIVLGGSATAFAILLAAHLVTRLRGRDNPIGHGDYGLAIAGGCWAGIGWVGPAFLVAVLTTLLIHSGFRKQTDKGLPFGPGLVVGFILATLAGVMVP